MHSSAGRVPSALQVTLSVTHTLHRFKTAPVCKIHKRRFDPESMPTVEGLHSCLLAKTELLQRESKRRMDGSQKR